MQNNDEVKLIFMQTAARLTRISDLIRETQEDCAFSLTAGAEKLALAKIASLESEREYLKQKFSRVLLYKQYREDVLAGTVVPTKSPTPLMKYFETNLKPHEFQYAQKGSPCDTCGKTQGKTAVVYTINPYTDDLEYICDYCHVDAVLLKQQKIQSSTSKQEAPDWDSEIKKD